MLPSPSSFLGSFSGRSTELSSVTAGRIRGLHSLSLAQPWSGYCSPRPAPAAQGAAASAASDVPYGPAACASGGDRGYVHPGRGDVLVRVRPLHHRRPLTRRRRFRRPRPSLEARNAQTEGLGGGRELKEAKHKMAAAALPEAAGRDGGPRASTPTAQRSRTSFAEPHPHLPGGGLASPLCVAADWPRLWSPVGFLTQGRAGSHEASCISQT